MAPAAHGRGGVAGNVGANVVLAPRFAASGRKPLRYLEPVRVILVTRSLDYGGAERQLVALARELHASGHDVVVTVFRGGEALQEELERTGVAVRELAK